MNSKCLTFDFRTANSNLDQPSLRSVMWPSSFSPPQSQGQFQKNYPGQYPNKTSKQELLGTSSLNCNDKQVFLSRGIPSNLMTKISCFIKQALKALKNVKTDRNIVKSKEMVFQCNNIRLSAVLLNIISQQNRHLKGRNQKKTETRILRMSHPSITHAKSINYQ